ncbi:MAG TPA: prepilin-type N-terminal cleavage/methylation domain-containing protein [Solirubrobacteraceae bacterium]|nr:prepilin-type N-terminal cleavage/methylation domain-containing protein [Solirubrobacteraceae bacterium]
MLHKLRQRAQDEKGFTLIELLVVILIIGILAAIALPAFLNQREKAQDSEAKSAARTAQTALETFYSDNQNYDVDQAAVELIEPTLKDAYAELVLTAEGDDTTYTITTTSKGKSNVVYTIESAAGEVTRTCAPAATGGCKAEADDAGNMW